MKYLLGAAYVCMFFVQTLQAADKNMPGISPAEDQKNFVEYFSTRFPSVPLQEFGNGIYALDEGQRAQWEEIEQFPPYEFAIDAGKALFETPFANGKSYASCFKNGGLGVRQDYPYFDSGSGQVKTLELAINECRENNGEKKLKYKKGDIAAISAYMAFTSRGELMNVKVPDEPAALAAYQDGMQFYYEKRGQLNFSCADCHVQNAGQNIRADSLSPGLGHPTHFPVYRSKWGELGTLHRRFGGCNKNVRATPLDAQSESYRNLEYFLSYMSNGLEINGPGARK
jgi:sulfur-oxidizing protein SoxA